MISKIGFGVKINSTRDMQWSLLAQKLSQTDGFWVSTKTIQMVQNSSDLFKKKYMCIYIYIL